MISLVAGLLRRARHTRTQTHLNLEGRAANVAGAFRAKCFPTQGVASEGQPHHLLLIDDVFTTGATAAACEMAVQFAAEGICGRPIRVSVATLACVEH